MDKKLASTQRRYRDHHGRQVLATITFRPGQWAFVESPPKAVTPADRMVTKLYSKLLLWQMGPYHSFSFTTEPVTIDENGIPSAISSDKASLARPSEIDALATDTHQSEYREALPGKFSTSDWPMDIWHVQRQIPTGITRATNKVKHDAIIDYAKWSKKGTKTDREYRIEHIVRHVCRGANSPYVMKWGKTMHCPLIWIECRIKSDMCFSVQ